MEGVEGVYSRIEMFPLKGLIVYKDAAVYINNGFDLSL